MCAYDRPDTRPDVDDLLALIGAAHLDDAFARIDAAPPLPTVPAAVLSSGKFMPPEALNADNYTQAQIHRSNDLLAAELGTVNRVLADSGHNVMLYSPQEVAQVIDDIVAHAASTR